MVQEEMADTHIVCISCAHMNAQLSHGINKSSQKKNTNNFKAVDRSFKQKMGVL